jgi:hypothetical protein
VTLLISVFEQHLRQFGLPVISCRVGNVPESSTTVTHLDVNGDPEVIAWPNAIDRLGEGKEGRLDGAHNWPSSSPPTS